MNDAVAQSEPTGIPIPAELSFDPADLRREFLSPLSGLAGFST